MVYQYMCQDIVWFLVFFGLPGPGTGPRAPELARALGLGPVPAPILEPWARAQALDPPKPKCPKMTGRFTGNSNYLQEKMFWLFCVFLILH